MGISIYQLISKQPLYPKRLFEAVKLQEVAMKYKVRSILDYLLTFILFVLAVKVLLNNIIDDAVISEIYRQFGVARISAKESTPVNSIAVWMKNIAVGFGAVALMVYGHKKKKAVGYRVKILMAVVILWGLTIF